MNPDILVTINQVINSAWFLYLPVDARAALQGAAAEITTLRAAQPADPSGLEARVISLETRVTELETAKLSIE